MTLSSVAAMNRSLDNDYGTTRGPQAASSHLVQLYSGDPTQGGAEITGPGYAPVEVMPADWPAAAEGSKTTVVTFPAPTGAWSVATHYLLVDPVTGDWWDSAPLTDAVIVTGPGEAPVLSLVVYYADSLNTD